MKAIPKTPPKKNEFVHAYDPKHLELLNTLTELQALNISSNFDLPQIIVCGSQSSGKSSVLEAITGIPFPRSDNTCTRFVIKVTLRPHQKEFVKVEIEQADSERESVPKFPPITNLKNLSTELREQFDKASNAILGHGRQTNFSRDILSITISGKDRPILQILDLPGLISHDPSNKENPDLVRDIVKSEMKKQHSTILAVVPANVDFKTQEVLSLCQKYDSEGKRTVGIITRPDTADNGQAITCVAIAKGERKDEVSIGHDWHVLRNRSTEELKNDTTVESRDAVEVDFLRQEPWVQLGTENLGVITLRTRLSKILLDAASQEFPKLADKISAKLLEITVESKRLGGDSMTDEQKRDIFYAGTEKLKKRTILYVSGDTLHDTSDHEASHAIHIRSRIVEQSELFRDRILKEGHSYVSQLEPPGINPNADLRTIAKGSRISAMGKLEPSSKTPKMEIQEAKKHLDELRGMELPGTFNPHHINIFFWQQSRNWNQIAMEHIVKTFRHCELYFEHATRMAFAPDPLLSEEPTFGNHEVIAQRVFRLICSDLEIMKGEAKKELGKLEIDRTHKQLNFNPKYMAENRQQRNAGNAKRSIEAVVKDPALQNKDSKGPVPELNPNTLAELQRRHTQDDRTEEEAENFLNAAWLQYKFMRDCYIANVLTQVIERHFMRKLVDITPNDRKIKSEVFQELVEEDRDLEKKKKNLKLRSEILQNA